MQTFFPFVGEELFEAIQLLTLFLHINKTGFPV